MLVWLGVQSFRRAGAPDAAIVEPRRARAFRDGLVTSLANPKLAVFFVALFPQFVGERGDVLPTTLAMAAMIVCFDLRLVLDAGRAGEPRQGRLHGLARRALDGARDRDAC